MSPTERTGRLGKLRTDAAISRAYARLAKQESVRATFDALLRCVWARAPLFLKAQVTEEHHPAVEALVNLSRYARRHVRAIETWPGSQQSWLAAVDSLAQHLLSPFRVPAFLSAAWYATDSYAEAKREWFVAHGRGASLRSLDLPIDLTRKMEHILLGSSRHYGIEHALRRAELLGLGAGPALVDAVLATRGALDLDHGPFWRTVWHFLIANADVIADVQIGPIVDYIHSIRHERIAVDTAEGVALREPPLPGFSLRGRTPRSLLRLMDEWHRQLGSQAGGLAWRSSPLRPMAVEVPPADPSEPATTWELTELTSSAELRAEGTALRHCVASYGYQCWRGASRIWSLRRRRGATLRSIATVEIHPGRRAIVQARGFANRRLTARELGFVQTWAQRENLRLAL